MKVFRGKAPTAVRHDTTPVPGRESVDLNSDIFPEPE